MSSFKAIRQRLGLNQADLAESLGLTQGAISFYERGVNQPTPAVAGRLIEFALSRGVVITYDDVYRGAQGEAGTDADAQAA